MSTVKSSTVVLLMTRHLIRNVIFMIKKMKESYLVSGILFLVLAYVGGRFRGWGKEEFAFLLLVYLIVIIGIRLDEMWVKLSAIETRLADREERRFRE
jgi:hypothetical protein